MLTFRPHLHCSAYASACRGFICNTSTPVALEGLASLFYGNMSTRGWVKSPLILQWRNVQVPSCDAVPASGIHNLRNHTGASRMQISRIPGQLSHCPFFLLENVSQHIVEVHTFICSRKLTTIRWNCCLSCARVMW